MKKSARNAMLLALGLCVLGLVIAFMGMLAMGFDFKKFDTDEVLVRTYTVDEGFSHITVMTTENDVRLALSEDESCRVACDETDQITYTVAASNGTLTVRENDGRKWHHHIGFHLKTRTVTVYLPRSVGEYGALHIVTNTGDVTVPEGFTFAQAAVETDTGDVSMSVNVTGQLSIEVDTGDMNVIKSSAQRMKMESDTGDITLSSSAVSEGLSLGTDSGEITVTDVTSHDVRIESDTGDVTLRNVMVEGAISVETDTGEVELIDSDAASIDIETSTGDVSGILLSDKTFVTETSTGDVEVPRGTSGGRCEIRTSTGDIEVRIKA